MHARERERPHRRPVDCTSSTSHAAGTGAVPDSGIGPSCSVISSSSSSAPELKKKKNFQQQFAFELELAISETAPVREKQETGTGPGENGSPVWTLDGGRRRPFRGEDAEGGHHWPVSPLDLAH